MGRSEGTSPSLESFIPERHLDGTESLDPYSYVFGFGPSVSLSKSSLRLSVLKFVYGRVCPGRHLADNALFMLVTSILACFSISKKSSLAQDALRCRVENTIDAGVQQTLDQVWDLFRTHTEMNLVLKLYQ